MQRQGECSQCGECCGAPGNIEDRRPWPTTWYPLSEQPGWRHWEIDQINETYPILSLVGVTGIGEDTIGIPVLVGFHRVKGKPYYYVWIPGHAMCKDTSAAHDGSSFSYECPFLMEDTGDGIRACALSDEGWAANCARSPQIEMTADELVRWQASYPGCSHTWTE